MSNGHHGSKYLHGLHDPGGERHMTELGKPGWVLFTEDLGHHPHDERGWDYSAWSNQGIGVISRLNNGYHPRGTIPHSSRYADFATRCGNFVRNSRGCHIWIIGNEMNFAVERPPADPSMAFDTPDDPDFSYRGWPERFSALNEGEVSFGNEGGEVITPERYVNCFRQCRQAVRSQPGHENDQVVMGGVAPWNNQTAYAGNPTGDWVTYQRDILEALGPDGCDGIAIHSYTHGTDPALIQSGQKMNAPFQNRHYHFRAYRDLMSGIPDAMRHLPVYLTEADEDEAWENNNRGWIRAAFEEIDDWNAAPGHQQIRAVILYRWQNHANDKWEIDGKQGVIDDFRSTVELGYTWHERPAEPRLPAADFELGSRVMTTTRVRFRREPGWRGKASDDLISVLEAEVELEILGESIDKDSLIWWPLKTVADRDSDEHPIKGWVAQFAPDGTVLLTREPPS